MTDATATAATSVALVDPREVDRNPENPRLIFRVDELRALESSIEAQGILVPLTVYRGGKSKYVLLDGERRWRCALKLGLTHVPVIVQPKPDRMQNIMMMFAIHNARKDWDPLPTALKMQELESVFIERQGRPPKEAELAELASMSRGEVRRLKKLLALPQEYRDELLSELQKPRSEQVLTVDHVLETTKGVAALVKRDVVRPGPEEDRLRKAILEKFRSRVERNTVSPRQLARIARAVERDEVSVDSARSAALRLIDDPLYTVDAAFSDSAADADAAHSLVQLVSRVRSRVEELSPSVVSAREVRAELRRLRDYLDELLD